MTRYAHVTGFVGRQVWALEEGKLDEIVEILRMRAAGITLSSDEIQARVGARPETDALSPTRQGGVAVLPLYGVLAPKMTMMTAISGGTSLERWHADFGALLRDPDVTAIVVDIDSPGGSVHLVPETFSAVLAARGRKPLVAVVNPSCASAAFWLAAAFDEIVCTPSGEVGSVGCYCVHEDWSQANQQRGVKPTYISYGRYKTEAHSDLPLADEARQHLQARVDEIGTAFEQALAKGRGVSLTYVRQHFGQGRMLSARAALAARMVDRIGTLRETVDRLRAQRAVPRTSGIPGRSAAARGGLLVSAHAPNRERLRQALELYERAHPEDLPHA